MPLEHTLKPILKSQYHAGLTMLRDAVDRCPEELWSAAGHVSAFWQVAYHTVFFTHLYLHRDEAAFRPWAGHQRDVQHQDGLTGPSDPTSRLPLLPRPYSKVDVLSYWQLCDQMVDKAVDAMHLEAADCGFWWYPVSKFEHQLINLRHLQHHTAQLADRLRTAVDEHVKWVGARPAVTGAVARPTR
jgi:hypothetical protein